MTRTDGLREDISNSNDETRESCLKWELLSTTVQAKDST